MAMNQSYFERETKKFSSPPTVNLENSDLQKLKVVHFHKFIRILLSEFQSWQSPFMIKGGGLIRLKRYFRTWNLT